MEKRKHVMTALVVVLVICVAGLLIYKVPGGTVRADSLYFYDLNTGSLFEAPVDSTPPIAAPSGDLKGGGGPAGVRAHVFRCGDNPDAEKFVAWIETYTPEMKARVAGASARQTHPVMDENAEAPVISMVAEPGTGDVEWFASDSEEGQALTRSLLERCPGSKPRVCRPGD